MAKVTAETMKPVHVRAARALLNMSGRELALLLGGDITKGKVRNFEYELPASRKTRQAIFDGIQAAGIGLLNGGKPGARVIDVEAYNRAVSGE